MIPDPIRVTIRVAEILEGLGIPHLFVGSTASSIYGEPRSTEDVDVVADLRPEHVRPLVSVLAGEFYIDEQLITRKPIAPYEITYPANLAPGTHTVRAVATDLAGNTAIDQLTIKVK